MLALIKGVVYVSVVLSLKAILKSWQLYLSHSNLMFIGTHKTVEDGRYRIAHVSLIKGVVDVGAVPNPF